MRTTIAACFLALTNLSCIGQSRTAVQATPESDVELGVRLQKTINTLKALQRGHGFPKHLLKENAVKRGDELDVQQYFTVLKHISMEKGYVLDYVYDYRELGGEPVLYARKTTQPPYLTMSEFKDAIRKRAHLDEVEVIQAERRALFEKTGPDAEQARDEADGELQRRLNAIPDREYWDYYLEHVLIDGTKEGYLQYILLYQLGGQFYLFWHACCNDNRIITDKSQLETILSTVRSSPFTSLEVLRAKAQQIDYSPRVDIVGQKAMVSFVTFSKWGGFIRQCYTISTQSPHKVLGRTWEVLAEYDCATVY